jgi:hypothetical protein
MKSLLLSPGARPSSNNASSKLPYVLLFCAFIALSGAFVNLQRCQRKLYSERELLRRVRSKLLLEARLAQEASLQREIDAIAIGESSAAAEATETFSKSLGPLQALVGARAWGPEHYTS